MAVAWWGDRSGAATPVEKAASAPGDAPASPQSLDDAIHLAEQLRAAGQSTAALSVLRRGIAAFPRGPGLAGAQIMAGDVLLNDLNEPTRAYQYLLATLDLDPSPAQAQAALAGLRRIDSLQKRQFGTLRSAHGRRS
jgi:hypothetical protein